MQAVIHHLQKNNGLGNSKTSFNQILQNTSVEKKSVTARVSLCYFKLFPRTLQASNPIQINGTF
jgi:hypothetical protein